MKPIERKRLRRERRKRHVRKKVVGTPLRPRLTVFRSHKNIYAQIIDDTTSKTLVAASSVQSPVKDELSDGGNAAAARVVGAALAAKAAEAGIGQVVFDRNGYAYHGRIRELAQAARDGGLKF